MQESKLNDMAILCFVSSPSLRKSLQLLSLQKVLKLRLNVIRELAGDGKVPSFECFSFVGRKYCNKDITLYYLNHMNYIKYGY